MSHNLNVYSEDLANKLYMRVKSDMKLKKILRVLCHEQLG